MKLIKAFAPWCVPCTAMSAILQGVNHPLVESMENFNVDNDASRAIKYGIRSIPAMILVNEHTDEVVKILVGIKNKEQILEFLEHGE